MSGVQVSDIQRAAADFFGVTYADLVGPERARRIVLPRHIAMYLARELTEHSLPAIGSRFGGRDHSTVLHGIVRVRDRCREPEIAASISSIRMRAKLLALGRVM